MNSRSRPHVARRGFSLAALLLAIAIIAVSLAMVRAAFQHNVAHDGLYDHRGLLAILIGGCGLAGAVFTLMLALWSRVAWYHAIAAFFGGLFVGAGAGAQASLPVPWTVICTVPLVLIVSTMLLMRPKVPRREEPSPLGD